MASFVERFIEEMQDTVPGLNITAKEDSRLMRFLARILFFNKRFLTEFITTIGKTIYVPQPFFKQGTNIILTLAHEAQHYWDNRRWKLLYSIGYLSPQIWALGSLLSLLAIWFSNWWLVTLACLIFLAPILAPFRMLIERRGYLMSLACCYWMYGETDVTWTLKYFTGSDYYFAWPFKKSLKCWFEQKFEKIKEGEFPTPVFEKVYNFLGKEKLLKNP